MPPLTKEARAIRLPKQRIKNMAQEISHFIYMKLGNLRGPQGKRVLHRGIPFDISAVDGTTLSIEIVLQATPSKDFRYVVSGATGARGGKPVAVVFFNGSIDFQKTVTAAKGSRLVQDQLYAVLIHELTHMADKFTKGVADQMTQEQAQDNPDYYNHPGEVRAYMQEVVDETERFFDKIPLLRKHFGPEGMRYLLNMSETWRLVSPHWTKRNQQLVMKAVAQAYDDWQQHQEKLAMAPSVPYPTDEYDPTKPNLWQDVLDVASGKRRELRLSDRTIHSPNKGLGFKNMPHNPMGIAWAVKQYNGFKGGWRKAAGTKNYEKAKKIIEEVGDALSPLSRIVSGWSYNEGQPPKGKEESQSRELAQIAARATKDLTLVFEDTEWGKRLQKKTIFRRLKNFHKLLGQYAKAPTWAKMEAVLLKQRTQAKSPGQKFREYAHESLQIIAFFDSEVEDTVKIEDYTVTLVSAARLSWDRDKVRKLEEVLKRTNKALKKVGLGAVTGGRVFAYPTDTLPGSAKKGGSGSALASYNIPQDKTSIAIGGGNVDLVTHSMVHELAHRFYFKALSGNGRKEWEQFFGDNVKPLDVDKVIQGWEAWANSGDTWAQGGRGRYLAHYYSVAKKKLSEDDLMWFKIILDKANIDEKISKRTGDVDMKGTPGLDQLIAKKGEIKAFLYPVSAYSATAADELFAEVMADYAYRGPGKVPEIVRDALSRAAPMIKSAVVGLPEDPDPLAEDRACYEKMKEIEKQARMALAAASPAVISQLTVLAEGRSVVWEIKPLVEALKLMVPGVKAKKTTVVQEVRRWNIRGALKARKVQGIVGSDDRYDKLLIFFKNEKMVRQAYKKIQQVAKIVRTPPKRGKAGELFLKGLHEPAPHPSYDWAIQIDQGWVAYSAYNVTVPEGTFLLVKESRGGTEYYRSSELSNVTRTEKYKSLAHDQLIELGALTPKKQIQKAKAGEGICPACFRGILLKQEKISRHGWEVHGGRRKGEWGLSWHSGPCFGTTWPPYEISPEGTKAFRKYVQERILPPAEEKLKKYQGRPDPIVVETSKGSEQIGQSDEKRYEQALGNLIRHYKEQVAALKEDIKFLDKAIQDWKPTEITTRKFTAFQQESLESLRRGSVVVTDHFEDHIQMQELEAMKLATSKAGQLPGQYFWSVGAKAASRPEADIPEQVQLDGVTYENEVRFAKVKFCRYAEQIHSIVDRLDGWRAEATQDLHVVLTGSSGLQGRVGCTYQRGRDKLLVRATSSILSRDRKYGGFEYAIVHALGQRYEHRSEPGQGFDQESWHTTRLSRVEGHAFPELFAIGHFGMTGTWDGTPVERFEQAMVAKAPKSTMATRVAQRFQQKP